MYIQTNINAMNALRNLGITEQQQSAAVQALSSGYRLNRAGDDAAGLSIANSMRSEGVALQQAQRNASQAGSLLQIADGAVQTLSTMLDRMKQLATESASANVTDSDRAKIDAEFQSLSAELDRIVNSTTYQGATLLKGTFGMQYDSVNSTLAGITNVSVSGAKAGTTYAYSAVGTPNGTATLKVGGTTVATATYTGAVGQALVFKDTNGNTVMSFTTAGDPSTMTGNIVTTAASASFRVGAGALQDSNNLVGISLGDVSVAGLGLTGASVATNASATSALTLIDAAVATLNTTIGTIGAAENRVNYATTSLNSLFQNVSAAEATIRDANMAQEFTTYTKLQILQQAGTAMLAHANTDQQSILNLVK